MTVKGASPLSLALALLIAAAPAGATLYDGTATLQFLGGHDTYLAHDLTLTGRLRLDGGWYPTARLSLTTDTSYGWIVAPGFGMEKGWAGVGRARLLYSLSRGTVPGTDRSGSSQTLETGFSRFFGPAVWFDVAYRRTAGTLFSGVDRLLNVSNGTVTDTLMDSKFHQGQVSMGWRPGPAPVWLQLSLSGARDDGSRRVWSEGAGVAMPLRPSVWTSVNLSWIQEGGQQRMYGGMGLTYAVSGHWDDVKEDSK